MRSANWKKNFFMNKHFKAYPSPQNLGYFWNFGSLLGLSFIIQLLTGISLAMYYTPHVNLAFLSVESIMRDVLGGWYLRYLHSNMASFFFFFIYFHVLKALLLKSYHIQNSMLWLSGLIIFFLLAGTAFLGYVLPWGQMSLWGATVITNLITAIPFIGKNLVIWIWGNFSINDSALKRFFTLHLILPFTLLGLIIIHILILHLKGSSAILGSFIFVDFLIFFPYYIYKDILGLLLAFIFIYFILISLPNFLVGHPDNSIFANFLVTPFHIVPEWYFLPFYAILRSIPDKLGGVLAMGSSMFIFFFKCFIDYSLPQAAYFRPVIIYILFFFCIYIYMFKNFWVFTYRRTFFFSITDSFFCIL